jgi:hypothetical protein
LIVEHPDRIIGIIHIGLSTKVLASKKIAHEQRKSTARRNEDVTATFTRAVGQKSSPLIVLEIAGWTRP